MVAGLVNADELDIVTPRRAPVASSATSISRATVRLMSKRPLSSAGRRPSRDLFSGIGESGISYLLRPASAPVSTAARRYETRQRGYTTPEFQHPRSSSSPRYRRAPRLAPPIAPRTAPPALHRIASPVSRTTILATKHSHSSLATPHLVAESVLFVTMSHRGNGELPRVAHAAPQREGAAARTAPHVVVAWSPSKSASAAARQKQALDEQQREAERAGEAVEELQKKEEAWWAWYKDAKAASDVQKAKDDEEAEYEQGLEAAKFERSRRERLEREREEHAAMLQAVRADREKRVQAEKLKEEERVRPPESRLPPLPSHHARPKPGGNGGPSPLPALRQGTASNASRPCQYGATVDRYPTQSHRRSCATRRPVSTGRR